ncbi:hypothetical protein XA68_12877 [Ophiocordyceps unilateralis]|uniref:GH16 domain-containing protein n=1 Tax=Ophiocordyceps unilateralis TaxID=268505 RepID=A0A2A9PCB2_OPHUN|nr:hypothetical protein XA68_12877 [Ophiocordyceps unilateralis]
MAYSLTASFAGQSLLNGFDWFDGVDPSHGSVAYQSRANAEAKGLFSVDENTGVVRLKVDHQHQYRPHEGRPSIRLESKETYNHGLFISDFLHMPPSQCGLWPAFWAYGSSWPRGGEVDIIEGVNTVHRNAVTAHTTDGCTLDATPKGPDDVYSGIKSGTSCASGAQNIGCGFSSPANVTTTYGDGFNAVNGGVYAMQWDSEHIKVWHFPRGEIPGDIEAKHPDPKSWKAPMAVFGGSRCNVDSFFRNMKLVININFCGDWGNAVWGKTDQCNAFAPTCSEYVARSPQAFANAYWDVRYIDTYRLSDGRVTAAPYSDTTVNMPTITSEPVTSVDGGALDSTMMSSFIGNMSAMEVTANPSTIGRYAYLGCFGSLNGFKTFRQVKESEQMTLEMCVELCDGQTFAGTVDAQCLCADSLDAETRAATPQEAAVCDHTCPGDEDEFCGGLRRGMPGAGGETMKFSSMPIWNASSTRSARVPLRRDKQRRSLSGNVLISLYAAVAGPIPPPLPAPPKGSGLSETMLISETAYRDVHPLTSTAALRAGLRAPPKAEVTKLPSTKLNMMSGNKADNGHRPAISWSNSADADSGPERGGEGETAMMQLRPPPGPGFVHEGSSATETLPPVGGPLPVPGRKGSENSEAPRGSVLVKYLEPESPETGEYSACNPPEEVAGGLRDGRRPYSGPIQSDVAEDLEDGRRPYSGQSPTKAAQGFEHGRRPYRGSSPPKAAERFKYGQDPYSGPSPLSVPANVEAWERAYGSETPVQPTKPNSELPVELVMTAGSWVRPRPALILTVTALVAALMW